MDEFDVGDARDLEARFVDEDGEPYDPETVRFGMLDGDGVRTPYVYGTHEALERVAEGVYRVRWTWATPGIHRWGYASTGDLDTAEETVANVRRPRALAGGA